MRKANKILMATVAILLCLVLITTSITSGIFARFVIMNKSESTITLQNFGVNVTMTVDKTLKDLVGEDNYEENKKGDSLSVTLSNLTMYPGKEFPEAVKFDFSGNPTTDITIKVYADISYSRGDFKVTKEQLNAILGTNKTADDYFVPIGLYLRVPNHTDAALTNRNILSPWRNVVYSTAERTVAQSVGRYTDLLYVDDNSFYYAYKDFVAGSDIVFYPDNTDGKSTNPYQNDKVNYGESFKFTSFWLGYRWPLTYDSRDGYTVDQISDIETWLMNQNRNFSYSVTFTVVIEQK